MGNWINNNIEWIFSGIGVFLIGGIIAIIKAVFNRKKKDESRTINLSGKKSTYIENNKGEINIK